DGELAKPQNAHSEPYGHDGVGHACGICELCRASLSHARRGPLLHGPERPHRARQISGRVGGDAVLYRGAGSRRLQMGVDPRAQPREVRPADGILDPDLHAPRDRVSPGDLRRLLSHGDAHRRFGCRLGEMAGAQEFEEACDVAAGHMAEGTLATCDTVFTWDEVRIWSR